MFKNIHVPGFQSTEHPSTSTNKHQEQSLTTILASHEDRTALLLLIANCTDSIRQSLVDNFDPDVTGVTKDTTVLGASSHDLSSSLIDLTGSQDAHKPELSQDDGELEPAEAEARKAAGQREKTEYERRVKELNSPVMLGLKEAAVNHFDAWRQQVLERVGEVVNSRDAEPAETRQTTTTKNAHQQDAQTSLPDTDDEVNTALHDIYPPRSTPLAQFDRGKRALILHSMLLLLLSLEAYTAHSRVLLLHLTSSLSLPLEVLTKDEEQVARGLLEAAKQHMNADDETKQKVEANKNSRKWKVGLGAVAGAALIGVTGGLAAPLLAAGVGSVMGGLGLGATAAAGYLGALAGSAPLVGALFGAYGGRMTSQMVDNYAREVEDFGFVPAQSEHQASRTESTRRLRVAIGISGWLTREADITTPWHVLSPASTETFALRWELQALLALGNAITTYIKSAAWGFAKTQIIKHTVFAALTAAMWPLAILKAARMVDNPFSVARSRSEKAGRVLADALINKVQGERPVTLFGYSMGARVIYSCLNELADRKAFGLVESAVLVGAPIPADSIAWRKMRAVVAGRLVNVYSTQDYLLAFLYRSTSIQLGVAGLQAVDTVGGVQNVDVSEIVDGHTQYRFLTGKVLKKVGFEDIDEEEVDKQMVQFKQQKKEEEAQREQNKAEAKDAGVDETGTVEADGGHISSPRVASKPQHGESVEDRLDAVHIGEREKQ